jgi:lipoprotein-anchoring transpeptidase ErfK/SrfK
MTKHKSLPYILLLLCILAVFLYFFPREAAPTTPTVVTPPPTPPIQEELVIPPPPVVKNSTYSSLTLTTESPLKELTEAVGKNNLDTVLRINRIDKAHVRTGAVLSIPSDFNYAALSPFPERIETISSLPKMILVSQTVQAFAVYENGTQIKWGPTSSGKKSTPTPNGLFNANWKGKEVISTSNDEWILKWNVNIANFLGVSLHQYELPGYPASHSCVRLFEEDAFWIYNWVDQWTLSDDGADVLAKGTPVLLFGQYDYAGIPPWKKLSENPTATTVELSEIEALITEYSNDLFPVVETIE